jgi:acyl-CoA synthetase (AMP-forming)/AMP-acid ligase II
VTHDPGGEVGRIAGHGAELRERWRAAGWHGDRTLARALREGADSFPGTAIHFVGADQRDCITLPQLLSRAEHVASALRAGGVGSADVIAVQVPNWSEGAVMFGAAMLLGAVIVPVIHIYGPAEVGFILRQSGARVLVVPDRWRNIDYVERLRGFGDTPALERVVVIGNDVPPGATAWADLEGSGRELAWSGDPDVDPDSVAFQIYTSGTTADPKGVQHSHNTMLAEIMTMAAALADERNRPTLGAFPAGHIAGVLSLLRCFVRGTSSVLLDHWDPHLAAAVVEEHGVGSSAGTPYFLTSLVGAAQEDRRDISSMDRFLVGAANVPPSVVELADDLGMAAYRSYGSTEHPTVSCGDPHDDRHRRVGTDGRLTPGNEVRIIDEDGRDVSAGSPGEIVTRGPEQFLGYSDPAHAGGSYVDGTWFRTGDIGVLADGYLTIVDRKKDIIIRGGENISSKEVEDLLLLHPAVADAAAVAAPDPRLGETVCAFVVLRPGAVLDLQAVRTHFAAAGVARQKAPERIEVVPELPRGHGGKVQKAELRSWLGGS